MSGFSFNDLNLAGSEISSGGRMLKPGKYVCVVKDATLNDTKKRDGSKKVDLVLEDIRGEGTIKAWLNVFIKDSSEATRIGRNELKTIMFYGGHPTPDRPGDIATLKGLKVGIVVAEQNYTDNFGNAKKGSEIKAYIDPAEVDPANFTPRAKPTAAPLNDDIPF